MSNPIKNDDYLFGRTETLRIFTFFCVLMVFDFADRMVIAAVLPQIKQAWQLTDAQSGMLSSALFLCMVLFAFPASFLIDNWSRTKTAGLMGALWSLASGAGAFVTGFPQLLATRAIVGAGEAGYLPAALAWLSSAFPLRRRQLATGILLSSQSVGVLFGLIAGAYIGSHFGWRHALGLLALPGLIVAVFVYRSKDYKSIKVPPASIEQQVGSQVVAAQSRFRVILQTPSLWIMFLGVSTLTLYSVPLQYFMPTFFYREHGIPLQQAAYISSGIMLCSVIAGPFGGWFMDRKSHFKPENKFAFAIGVFAINALIYGLAFGVVQNLYLRLALLMLAAFVGASIVSMIMTVTQELVPRHLRAFSSTSCIVTAHLLGSVPGPWLAGRLSDAYGLTHALLSITTVCSLTAVVLMTTARHFYRRDFVRTEHYRAAPVVEAGT